MSAKPEVTNPKCTVRDELFVDPCETLENVIHNNTPGFSKRKGVAIWHMRKRVGGKTVPSRTYLGIICEAYPDGFLFNFCPFCGTDISAPFMEPEEASA